MLEGRCDVLDCLSPMLSLGWHAPSQVGLDLAYKGCFGGGSNIAQGTKKLQKLLLKSQPSPQQEIFQEQCWCACLHLNG